MRVPGQVGGEQEAGAGGLAPGALARVSQAVVTGQPPGGRQGTGAPGQGAAQPPPHPHAPSPRAQRRSLAAEWGALFRTLQGAPTPAAPAARRVPLAAGALMPLTEGVLGGRRRESPAEPSPGPPGARSSAPAHRSLVQARLPPAAREIHGFCLTHTARFRGSSTTLCGPGGADPIPRIQR